MGRRQDTHPGKADVQHGTGKRNQVYVPVLFQTLRERRRRKWMLIRAFSLGFASPLST